VKEYESIGFGDPGPGSDIAARPPRTDRAGRRQAARGEAIGCHATFRELSLLCPPVGCPSAARLSEPGARCNERCERMSRALWRTAWGSWRARALAAEGGSARGQAAAARRRVAARPSPTALLSLPPPRQSSSRARPPALPDTTAAASSVAMSDPVDIKGDVRAAASAAASGITARLLARGRAAGSLTAALRSWRRPASRRAARRCRCTRRAAGEWGGEAWLGETLRRLLRAVRRCSAGLPRGERSGAAAVERSRCQWFSFRFLGLHREDQEGQDRRGALHRPVL